jgi:DNA-binding MurR/RpiR family transcriptional regulator
MAAFEERIRSARLGLSPSFSRLADFLLDSYTLSAFLTATELAHTLDVDPATVVRFSQHLGYRGYPELQREIRKKVKSEILVDRSIEANTTAEAAAIALDDVAHNVEALKRSFPEDTAKRLIAALDEAERVVLLAEGFALSPAISLANWLEAAGYTVHRAGGSPAELAQAIAGSRKGDLAIVVGVNKDTAYMTQALVEVKKAGARTAAIVAAPSAEAADHAEWILAAQANSHPGIGQIMLECLIYTFVQMLIHTRPGRFKKASERVRSLTQSLTNR